MSAPNCTLNIPLLCVYYRIYYPHYYLSYLVLYCAGFEDSESLRMEVISQLCQGDRTHSALLDLMPEKSGLRNSYQLAEHLAKVEAAIHSCADFRAPKFETAHSALSQGTYTLKGNSNSFFYSLLLLANAILFNFTIISIISTEQ